MLTKPLYFSTGSVAVAAPSLTLLGRLQVVLRYGGVYADMDTECRVPLDSYLSDSDTLVAGWENEFRYVPEQIKRSYSRQRQVTCPSPAPESPFPD